MNSHCMLCPQCGMKMELIKNIWVCNQCVGLTKAEPLINGRDEMKKSKKLKMWIVCCDCQKQYSLVDNINKMEAERLKLTYYSQCPYCYYRHKIIVVEDDCW